MANDPMIKASHEKAKNAYGQNGSPQSSSLLPGQSKSPIADVSPKQTSVPGLSHDDTLAHRVKMDGDKAAAYPHHDGLPPRGSDCGSPGGRVPQATIRRDSGTSPLK